MLNRSGDVTTRIQLEPQAQFGDPGLRKQQEWNKGVARRTELAAAVLRIVEARRMDAVPKKRVGRIVCERCRLRMIHEAPHVHVRDAHHEPPVVFRREKSNKQVTTRLAQLHGGLPFAHDSVRLVLNEQTGRRSRRVKEEGERVSDTLTSDKEHAPPYARCMAMARGRGAAR
jgi:hypothetical protein